MNILKSRKKGVIIGEHQTNDGDKIHVEVKVDEATRKWFLTNTKALWYDITTDRLWIADKKSPYGKRPAARAAFIALHGKKAVRDKKVFHSPTSDSMGYKSSQLVAI
jgi:hypothetical protein